MPTTNKTLNIVHYISAFSRSAGPPLCAELNCSSLRRSHPDNAWQTITQAWKCSWTELQNISTCQARDIFRAHFCTLWPYSFFNFLDRHHLQLLVISLKQNLKKNYYRNVFNKQKQQTVVLLIQMHYAGFTLLPRHMTSVLSPAQHTSQVSLCPTDVSCRLGCRVCECTGIRRGSKFRPLTGLRTQGSQPVGPLEYQWAPQPPRRWHGSLRFSPLTSAMMQPRDSFQHLIFFFFNWKWTPALARESHA